MTWTLRPREFEWATGLPPLARYAYTVNKVREHGELWSLRSDDGWVVGLDPDADPVFPIWPHPDFAVVEGTEEWSDACVDSISLHRWLHEITPMLQSRGLAVGVYTTQKRWVHVGPQKFVAHLESEPRKRYDLPRRKDKPSPR